MTRMRQRDKRAMKKIRIWFRNGTEWLGENCEAARPNSPDNPGRLEQEADGPVHQAIKEK